MNDARVGVLALQGGYQRHIDCLGRIGIATQPIRHASDLHGCTALILPGGESTSMARLIEARGLLSALSAFACSHPVLGTCAGLILMARCADTRVVSLGVLDVTVARNAYGRQTHSFQADLRIDVTGGAEIFPGIFIRAPQIVTCDRDVQVLAWHDGRAVLVAQGPHMGMSFHPELSGNPRIHAFWLARAEAWTVASAPRQVSA